MARKTYFPERLDMLIYIVNSRKPIEIVDLLEDVCTMERPNVTRIVGDFIEAGYVKRNKVGARYFYEATDYLKSIFNISCN